MPTKEAKTQMETHKVTVEAKISKCLIKIKSYKPFCVSYLSIHFALFLI